jgi:hypothetical protein
MDAGAQLVEVLPLAEYEEQHLHARGQHPAEAARRSDHRR